MIKKNEDYGKEIRFHKNYMSSEIYSSKYGI